MGEFKDVGTGYHKEGLDGILDSINFFKEENPGVSEEMLKFLKEGKGFTTFTLKEPEDVIFHVALLKTQNNYHIIGSDNEESLSALVEYFKQQEEGI